MRNLIRNGDVLLIRLRALPFGSVELPPGSYLVFGETGNVHTIKGAKFYEGGGQPIVYVPNGEEATIEHPGHGRRTIPPGVWRVRTARKYDSRTDSWQPYLD